MYREIGEYTSDDGYKRAIILLNVKEDCFAVDFYKNGTMVDAQEFPGKSIYYAQDAAENWVLGVIK